jgi:hypothetical protein
MIPVMATAAPVIFRRAPGSEHGAGLTWFRIVTAGEIVAFAIPLVVGVVAAQAFDAEGWALWGIVVAAGAAEGLVLGIAQAIALKQIAPAVDSRLWVAATTLGAAVAWAFAWLVPTYADRGEPAGVVAGVVFLAIPVALIALTLPQSELLSLAKVRAPYLWMVFASAAWIVALPLVFIGGLFVDDNSSTAAIIAAFGAGGIAMAATMAAISGWAIEWLTARGPSQPAEE